MKTTETIFTFCFGCDDFTEAEIMGRKQKGKVLTLHCPYCGTTFAERT